MTPEELFQKNLNLVYHTYHRYFKRLGLGSHYDDLIQEGMLGLWRACLDFDESLGYAFSTYAVATIRGAMNRYRRDKINAIRIPRSVWENGNFEDCSVVSLDEAIDEEDKVSRLELVPGRPDDYETLTYDLIEQFLEWEKTHLLHRYAMVGKVSNVDTVINIIEDYLYGIMSGCVPNQVFLRDKYKVSQPQISRIIKKIPKDFTQFITE